MQLMIYEKSYKNNYSNPGREYNYNDFANYQTDKRYTDYHRQKTPSSDYKDQRKTEDVSSKMMGIYDKLTSGKRFLAILAVLIAYCILVMTTISKFNLVFSGKETGPLLNEENPTELFVPEIPEELPPSSEQSLPLREDFDIHDYMSEEDLLTLYNSRFKDEFNTYDEFSQIFEKVLEFPSLSRLSTINVELYVVLANITIALEVVIRFFNL